MNVDDIGEILNALHVPAACLRQTGQMDAFNAPFQGLYPAAVIGRPYGLILRRPELAEAVQAAIAQGRVQSAEIEATHNFRDQRWLVTVAPLQGEDTSWVLMTFEDRTALEETAQIRRDFVANVSHELRSPLTALLGFIETLRSAARDDAAARERFLSIMEREANRMTRLVQDLLSLSRVEAEERLRPTERADLTAIIDGCVALLAPAADEAGIRFRRDGLDRPLEVTGDPDQLRQVFTNLLENAVKYGGGGGLVEIRADPVAHDPGLRSGAVRIEVTDHGEGFDPHHIPRLTERFYRIDDHRSREMGGTGLGLAIVKHIVNRHRGRLKIESVPGQGSRFTVLLPV